MNRLHGCFLLLFVLLSLPGFSQYGPCPDELFPRYDKKKRMWGFSNFIGEWVIQPFYTKVSPFIENKAVVQKGLSYGVINCEGNVVLPPKYEAILNFKNGKTWVKENGLWGFADDGGRVWVSPQFSEIYPIPHSELSWVKKGDKWGLFNEERKQFTCKPAYQVAKVLSPNSSMVQVASEKFGVLNHVNCSYLIEPNITSVKKVNASTILFKSNDKWGVFNYEGRIKANPEYDSIYLGCSNLLVVKKGEKEGLIDLDGKTVLAPDDIEFGPFNEGLFVYKKGGKFGYINLIGKIYIPAQFEEARPFINKKAIVKESGKYGLIDIKKNFVLEPRFSSIEKMEYHPLYVVAENQRKYIYTLDGNRLSDSDFQNVYLSDSSELIRVVSNDKISFINVNTGKSEFTQTFDDAQPFSHGYAIVKSSGKWGVIDRAGASLVPAQYDQILLKKSSNRIVFNVFANGLEGIYTSDGKEVMPAIYQSISLALPNYLKIKQNGKYGIMKTDGTVILPPTYDYMSTTDNEPEVPHWPTIIAQDGKYGLMDFKDHQLVEIVKPKSGGIFYAGENQYVYKLKKKQTLVNSSGIENNKVVYDSIASVGNKKVAVFNGKSWGYVDLQGKEVIPFQFEEAGRFAQRVAIVKQSGKYGVIDTQGTFLEKPEYDSWVEKEGNRYLIKNGQEVLVGKDWRDSNE